MPLYEYRCQACGHQFEVLQRLDESAEGQSCPGCGHEQVVRMFSTFAAGVGGGGDAGQVTMPTGGCCRGTPT